MKLQKWPYAAHRTEVLKCLSAKVRSQQKTRFVDIYRHFLTLLLDLLIFIDTSRYYFMPFRKYWCLVYHKRHPSLRGWLANRRRCYHVKIHLFFCSSSCYHVKIYLFLQFKFKVSSYECPRAALSYSWRHVHSGLWFWSLSSWWWWVWLITMTKVKMVILVTVGMKTMRIM